MKKMLFKEKYPIYTLEIFKNEIKHKNIDDVIGFLKSKIGAHPVGVFIAIFDHMAHSKAFNGETVEGMINARNIIFCIGKNIPSSKVMSLKPRSIGISEFEDKFEFGMLEVPNEENQATIESWIKELAK
jgi:hypothetical protein